MQHTLKANTDSQDTEFTKYVFRVNDFMKKMYGLKYTEIVDCAPSSDYYGVRIHDAFSRSVPESQFGEYLAKKLSLIGLRAGINNRSDIPEHIIAKRNRDIVCLREVAHQPDCEWLMIKSRGIIRKNRDHGVLIYLADPVKKNGEWHEAYFVAAKTQNGISDLSHSFNVDGLRHLAISKSFKLDADSCQIFWNLDFALEYAGLMDKDLEIENELDQSIQDGGETPSPSFS